LPKIISQYTKGKLWRLSPAFDLNHFPDRLRELKTWISEDTGPEASIDALMSVIAYFRIGKEKAKMILTEVESAVSQWRKVGKTLSLKNEELDQFSDAFEHPERKKARLY
jgi:serine/threonine-protein kinase HipA